MPMLLTKNVFTHKKGLDPFDSILSGKITDPLNQITTGHHLVVIINQNPMWLSKSMRQFTLLLFVARLSENALYNLDDVNNASGVTCNNSHTC